MSAAAPPYAVTTLAQAAIGQAHRVKSLQAPDYAPEWQQWLEELGFVSGEHVSVLARALPGQDPLVVRVGQSTYALRRAEADCVQLHTDAHAGNGNEAVEVRHA